MDLDAIDEATLRRRSGAKWSHYPANVLPAWVADMDYAVAEPIRAALAARVAHSDLGYPQGLERSGLRELFAERMAARFAWQVSPAEVLVLADVVQGLYLCLHTLSAPGDGVVIQTPIYPPFLHATAETGRRAVLCPLRAGRLHYEIDFEQLEAAIDAGTRVLMVCHPHNPSGRAFTRDELERLAEIACRHDLVIVSDEIHADLMLDDRRHVPLASLAAEVAARTVTLMSASKAFNIAGLCQAFAHFGSAAIRQRFEAWPAHSRGSVNTLAIAATLAAWHEAQPWQDAVLVRLRENRARVAAFARTHWPTVRHFPPQATYLAWFDLRPLALSEEPYELLLREAQVAVSPGRNFGSEGAGHVRLNFATTPAILEAILERLRRALEAYAGG